MLLSPEDAEHFLKAYKALLQQIAGHKLNETKDHVAARGALYTGEHLRQPPTDDLDLLAALKTAVYGNFFIGRHLKRATEMVASDNEVYRVKGITTELGDIAPPWVYAKTVVMCFREQWICDGLIEGGNILIGSNMRRELQETIRAAEPPPVRLTRKIGAKRKPQPLEKSSETTDKAREERIAMEIVVDAYDDVERALGWYYYLENNARFPFTAKCIGVRSVSPLKKGETVEVLGMPPEEDCEREIFVKIQWEKRKMAVPLSQLEVVKGDAQTKEAVADWHYWVKQGYRF